MSTKAKIEEAGKERGCCGGHMSDMPTEGRSGHQDRHTKQRSLDKKPLSDARPSCCGGSNDTRSADLGGAAVRPISK